MDSDVRQITAWHEHGGEPPEYPETWNNAAPLLENPENFEARMTHIDGRRQLYWYENGLWWYFAGQDSTPWLNITDMAKFRYMAKTNLQVEDLVVIAGEYQLEIREVDKPETVKIKSLNLRLWIQT